MKQFFFGLLFCIIYLLVSFFLIGYRQDQLVLAAIFLICYSAHPTTRKFILGFSIYIAYWILFDAMKAFPNYRYAGVSIEPLYTFEKNFFGIHTLSGRLTLNEFFYIHHQSTLDILCGMFYLTWVPVPMAMAFWLYLKDRMRFINFSLTFVAINLLGFIIYYLYPAAPPWYVALYGFDLLLATHGNSAGLARFDQLVHLPIFEGIYSKSSNVFAALPSLHSAYPVLLVYTGLKYKLGWVNLFFAVCMVGIWTSAVYTGHHYIVDVLAGILCALCGIVLYEKAICKLPWVQKAINNYHQMIK